MAADGRGVRARIRERQVHQGGEPLPVRLQIAASAEPDDPAARAPQRRARSLHLLPVAGDADAADEDLIRRALPIGHVRQAACDPGGAGYVDL
jgi:hypothetical protein